MLRISGNQERFGEEKVMEKQWSEMLRISGKNVVSLVVFI